MNRVLLIIVLFAGSSHLINAQPPNLYIINPSVGTPYNPYETIIIKTAVGGPPNSTPPLTVLPATLLLTSIELAGPNATDFLLFGYELGVPVDLSVPPGLQPFQIIFLPSTHLSSPHLATVTFHTDQGDFILYLEGDELLLQTITFNPIPAVSVNTASTIDLNLYASSDSGLPLTYFSSKTSVATISGSIVTIVGKGTTTITAYQYGDNTYGDAWAAQQTLTVTGAGQSITFNSLPPVDFGSSPFALGATASSGLPVSYQSSNTSVATISGNTVTVVGGGATIITAKQAGNSTYAAATNVPQTLIVNPLSQSITFNSLAPVAFGSAQFTLGATASSGLPVSYQSSNASVATVSGNTVTIVGGGSTVITASQAGNNNYSAAPNVTQTLTVNPATQTITFNALSPISFGSAPFTLGATAGSGLPVSYQSSNTSVATISGNTVTIVGGGSTVITAIQSGNDSYAAAANVTQPLTVNPATQTITFGALTSVNYGSAPFTLGATASSGLPVSYQCSNTSVALISGNTVTIVGGGSAVITASQSGNNNYAAATNVTQPLTVNPLTQTITFNPLSSVNLSAAPFALIATASSGLPVSYQSSNTSVATISGNTVTLVGGGITTITASQAGNNNYNAATNVAQSLTVIAKLSQTISFTAIPDVTIGDSPITLSAFATSGLPVTFNSIITPAALTGNTFMIILPGRNTITADQSGNTTYFAAPPVSRSFCINPAQPSVAISDDNTTAPILTSSSNAGNQWFLDGAPISGATNKTLSITSPGVYTVTVKVDDCVSVPSAQVPIIVTGDIASVSTQLTLYPNPTHDFIFISGIHETVTTSLIIDPVGRCNSSIILEQQGDVHKGNISGLNPGLYILQINEGGKVHQIKFIKQ